MNYTQLYKQATMHKVATEEQIYKVALLQKQAAPALRPLLNAGKALFTGGAARAMSPGLNAAVRGGKAALAGGQAAWNAAKNGGMAALNAAKAKGMGALKNLQDYGSAVKGAYSSAKAGYDKQLANSIKQGLTANKGSIKAFTPKNMTVNGMGDLGSALKTMGRNTLGNFGNRIKSGIVGRQALHELNTLNSLGQLGKGGNRLRNALGAGQLSPN